METLDTINYDFKNEICSIIDAIDNKRGSAENMLSILFQKDPSQSLFFHLNRAKSWSIDDIHNDHLNFIFDSEQIPDDWQEGLIRPLHKSGYIYELDNYRGINLSSNIYKPFFEDLRKVNCKSSWM